MTKIGTKWGLFETGKIVEVFSYSGWISTSIFISVHQRMSYFKCLLTVIGSSFIKMRWGNYSINDWS